MNYLISCVGKKREGSSPAKDLYISEWFLKARRYVEDLGATWFILSAEYGLVKPDDIIEAYDKTLNNMKKPDRREWARMVSEQLQTQAPGSDFVFLAGERYREFLVDPIRARGAEVSVPMAGLFIGQQLAWFNAQR